MNFFELEQLMSSRGVTSLAEIARILNTTPQAVSNWKSRNQVPHHIVATINKTTPPADSPQSSTQPPATPYTTHYSPFISEEDTGSLSDFLVTMAMQIKVIFLTTFIFVFFTFTYVQFIKQPLYVSKVTILLPEETGVQLGGLAGIASQFGVNVPTGTQADLSSPSLFPELIKSRTFAEKILDKKFYTNKFGEKKTLLEILSGENYSGYTDQNTLVTTAIGKLGNILKFEKRITSAFSVISVTTAEPLFSKELADEVLVELETLNLFYKNKKSKEKINFIENRIKSVENDLSVSEMDLRIFNEQNRQLSSPALRLEQERLTRGLEIQKGIFLTLRQQHELAKIEEMKDASVIQVLDKPQIPIDSMNINTKRSVIAAGIIGFIIGVLIGFIRNYTNNGDVDERKKLRRVKFLLNKKIKDIFKDSRIPGIVGGLMLIGLPLFLGYESNNPVFFGLYSPKFLIVNIVYVLILLFNAGLFIHLMRNKDS